jgi:hypothetical protein
MMATADRASVFLLAENRLLREALARILDKWINGGLPEPEPGGNGIAPQGEFVASFRRASDAVIAWVIRRDDRLAIQYHHDLRVLIIRSIDTALFAFGRKVPLDTYLIPFSRVKYSSNGISVPVEVFLVCTVVLIKSETSKLTDLPGAKGIAFCCIFGDCPSNLLPQKNRVALPMFEKSTRSTPPPLIPPLYCKASVKFKSISSCRALFIATMFSSACFCVSREASCACRTAVKVAAVSALLLFKLSKILACFSPST